MPKEGVVFLERVDRFEKLGFDSTKNVVYIHCSKMCQDYAKIELGFVPHREPWVRKEPLALSYNFGASYDLDIAQEELVAEKESDSSKGITTRRGTSVERKPAGTGIATRPHWYAGFKCKTEKVCPVTSVVLETFDSMSDAAKSVGSYGAMMSMHFKKAPKQVFNGFHWRPACLGKKIEKLCPATLAVLDTFESLHAAAESVNSHGFTISVHLKKRPTELFNGFYWRFQEDVTDGTQQLFVRVEGASTGAETMPVAPIEVSDDTASDTTVTPTAASGAGKTVEAAICLSDSD